MPRAPRLQFEGAFYHAYHRGNRRQPIFLDDQDYFRFESFLFEAMNRTGIRLYNWKQMPNHFHLLVETPDGNLAEFMQQLLTRYAIYFNTRHRQVGHLFQGRYGAKVCDKDTYFKELIRYIQLNAYRSKGKPLAELGEWKWSSHRYLMMPKSQWPEGLQRSFQDVLDLFSDDPNKARHAYCTYLADGLNAGTWKDFYRPKGDRFLGNDSFVEKVKRQTGEEVRQLSRNLKHLANPEALLEVVANVSGIGIGEFSTLGQRRLVSRWRQAYVYAGRRWYRWPVKTLAHAIGRQGTAVSQILRRMGSLDDLPEVERLSKALQW